MQLVVKPTPVITGTIIAPSSKSHSVRALFFALLAKGTSQIKHILAADDTQDTLALCQMFALEVEHNNDDYAITSAGLPLRLAAPSKPPYPTLYTGNSGIATHFMLPLLGLRKDSAQVIKVTCNTQMQLRPIAPLVDALSALGLTIHYTDQPGFLPITIANHLHGGNTEVAGITSQYLSALLIALPCAPKDSEITVHHLRERPYVDMTLSWLKDLGIHVSHHRTAMRDTFMIPGRQTYQAFTKTIPGDFSSASYLIAAAAMTQGVVTISNLDMQDPQADKALIYLLQSMGATIWIDAELKQIRIQGGQPLQGMRIDASDYPDLLPTLAVIGSYAQGTTEIVNVPHARIKETDRIHAIAEGLQRLGCRLTSTAESMTIYHSQLTGAYVNGYGDHRTVMALSIAGLIAQGQTIISAAAAINKTYPTFITAMQTLGANFEVSHASNQ